MQATNTSDLIIISGYRTQAKQKQLYDADLIETGLADSKMVSKAGYSEHHTGLALDFAQQDVGFMENSNEYRWFEQHCYQYGFVVRYRSDKVSITGIDNEPWHFRYVGNPHATIMHEKDLCLEAVSYPHLDVYKRQLQNLLDESLRMIKDHLSRWGQQQDVDRLGSALCVQIKQVDGIDLIPPKLHAGRFLLRSRKKVDKMCIRDRCATLQKQHFVIFRYVHQFAQQPLTGIDDCLVFG